MSEPLTSDQNLASSIARIAGLMSSNQFPTGERASLRRMAPGQIPPLGFYRFAMRYLPEGWERNLDEWTVLVAGMAIMAPNAHDPRRGFGTALAISGYSEARLERLLSAEGETRRTLVLRAARFLAAKGVAFNWVDAAAFLLTRHDELREQIHRRIARDYYRENQRQTG